jgi:hypothetical protein
MPANVFEAGAPGVGPEHAEATGSHFQARRSPAPCFVTSHQKSPEKDTGRSMRNCRNIWQWIFKPCSRALAEPEQQEHGYGPECKPRKEK